MNDGFIKFGYISVFIFVWSTTVIADEKLIPDGMVVIPKGTVKWSRNNLTVYQFYMDQYETVQQSYEKITDTNPSYFKGPKRPVEKVNWFEANKYCKRIGKRLPTEWEWQRAAQLEEKINFSKQIAGNLGWFKRNSEFMTHPVGQKKQNLYGLYDMTGNVWEWTASDHENGGKVMRGGSWRNSADSMRPSKRIMSLPHYRYHYVGFRCAASINPKLEN